MSSASPRTGVKLLVGAVLVAAVVVTTILVVLGTAARRQADDPRSPTPTGAGALGALLQDQGIDDHHRSGRRRRTAEAGPGSTLVVANADADPGSGGAAARRRPVTHRAASTQQPGPADLRRRGRGVAPESGRFDPDCGVDAAVRAGTVVVEDPRAGYRPTGPADFSCYPNGDGYAYLGVRAANGSPIQLLAGGVGNAVLGKEGNAALAMNVLGSQPKLIWLMASRTEARNVDPADAPPRLLPVWWQIGVVQAFVALVVVGIWRGRRLGPILQ